MQNWARRGLQAALVTGGLLMLGTGIASADERFDPDAPPSPLDGGVSVPVKVGNFNVGTPMGEENIPVVIDEKISTGDGFKEGSAPFSPYMKNNVLAPNVLAPVEASGWAVAAGGEAHNTNTSHTSHTQGGDISTSGEGDGLAGNVVAPTVVAPAQVTGIAFPLLGSASVDNDTDQESTAGGSVETNGDDSAGSGNIVAPQVAAPMAVNNTAAGWFAGVAKVDGKSAQSANAKGTHATSGDGSMIGGNIAGAPVSGPAHVDGTAASWGGIAKNNSENSAVGMAGTSGSATRAEGDSYATTSGDDSVGGGNVATPQGAPLATVDCTAGAWGGISTSECTDTNSSEAGGDVASSGEDSLVGGNIADAPVAAPWTVMDTAGAWGGKADAVGTDSTTAEAGGSATSAGDDSVLGGNIAGTPTSGPASVDCTAGAWGGIVSSECDETTSSEAGNVPEAEYYAITSGDDSAGGGNVATSQLAPLAAVDCTAGVWGGITSTECANDTTSEAGGGDMTTGDDSTLGGNIVDPAAAVPAEGYSNAGAWGGDAEAIGEKTVHADAGGMEDTSGEDSTGGGNIVGAPVSAPTAVDCNAGVWGGQSTTDCVTESSADSGANTHTNGEDSVIGGNTAQAPLSPVSSASGNAGSWIGDSEATLDNSTMSGSGADTFTQGDGSVIGGNQAIAPVASAEDVTCVAGTWVGEAECTGDNTVTSEAGGYEGTTGDNSTVGGNIVTTPQAPVAEVFGVAGAWGGDSTSTFAEDKDVTAGGTSNTDDDRGTGSSNVVAAPWAPAAQVSNIAAAWIGNPTSKVDSDTKNTAGGNIGASAVDSTASGNIVEAPAALPADVHTIAATWGGNALAEGTHNTESTGGGNAHTDSTDSAASGNLAGAQGAGAANVYGWAASWVGNNLATSDKSLSSTAGGDTTTNGDNASLSGNQVLADGNGVAGVFGNTASFVADDEADTTTVTDVTSGGDAVASGDAGNASGNVAQADAQPLAQVFGINAAAVGSTLNNVDQTTTATNGGDLETSGTGGNLAGDVIDADAQAPWQVFGIEAGALGNPVNTVAHETTTTNSGDNVTTGDGGNLAGDVVNADAQGPIQIMGANAAALGNTTNTVSDSLQATNGGSSETSGVGGGLSGDIVSGEAQAAPQVIGWGVAALSNATQGTTSDATAANGGDLTTAGTGDQLSGNVLDVVGTADPGAFGWAATAMGNNTNITDTALDATNGGTVSSAGGEAAQIPIGLAPQINEIEIPIGGTTNNVLTNDSSVWAGNSPAAVLPSMPGQRSDVPTLPVDAPEVPVSTTLPALDGLPAAPGVDGLPALPDAGSAPAVPGVDGLPALPDAGSAPAVPGVDGLPAVPGADAFPASPDAAGLPGITDLPTLPGGMSAMPGLQAGLDAFQAGMPSADAIQASVPSRLQSGVPTDLPTGRQMPLTPQANLGQTSLPDAGSVSGTLPLGGDLPAMPALAGLDTAKLQDLLSGFPTM